MTRERDKKLGKEQQLLEAARLGQFNQLETILRQFEQLKTKKRSNPLASLRKCIGPNNIRDPVTGFTCLHHAALNGHTQCVQLILNHGARLNAVDYKGSSALHLAAWSGNLQVIKALLSYSTPSSRSATLTTVEPGNHRSSSSTSSVTQVDDQAQSLKSSSPSARNKQRPVDENKHEELDLNLRNNDGQTALSLAAQFGHKDVVAELLCYSADVNLRNNQLESPLDTACLNGHLETVRLILNSSPQLVHDLRRSHSTLPITIGQSSRESAGTSEQPDAKSRSGWSSLLRGNSSKSTVEKEDEKPRRASLAANKSRESNQHETSGWAHQSSLDSSQPVISGRLLDHSPLHYAVRRCHVNIVSLLLDQYEANLFQLTSLGSVMHEIVINNCDPMTKMSTAAASNGSQTIYYTNGDMMKLFLAHLSRISAGDLNETCARWKQLLSARNGQQMNVFDIINELNTRPAQELKRNIFQLNEQIERSLKIQNQQQQQSIEAQNYSTRRENSLNHDTQGQIFSNARQINSFLTMKRAQHKLYQKLPLQHDNATILDQVHCRSINDGRQYNEIDGTQTIDRRRVASARNKDIDSSDWRQDVNLSGDQALLTRSVSNLIYVNNPSMRQDSIAHPNQLYGSIDVVATSARNDSQESKFAQEQLRNVQMIQRKIDDLQKRQQSNTMSGVQTRKKRSKSRDLGSLLMEVNQNQQLNDEQIPIGSNFNNTEQLYDNQMALGTQTSDQHHENHLVRSQTDCSHLLGRLGGDDHQSTNYMNQQANFSRQQQFNLKPRSSDNSSSLLATSHQDNRRLMPTTIAQQHSATLDRRAINRHYHVYDHEFYPPRLVTDQTGPLQPRNHHNLTPARINACSLNERQKQAAIAIVPPLVRSDLSHSDQSSGSINGRLSLNIDRSPEHANFNYNYRLANVDERQLEQMNRFVNVDSRKSMPIQNGIHQSRQQSSVDTGYAQQQQQALHNSQSFDSHFASESQQKLLFESTRQALMRDFDKMIGHELLHQDEGSSGNNSLGRMANSASLSSQSSSILTGVSLDMDTQGEHLVVSGTRVTMPLPTRTANSKLPRNRSSHQNECNRAMDNGPDQQKQVLQSSHEKIDTNRQSLLSHSSSSASSNSTASNQRKPPQKPPRPSLRSQQIYKSLQLDTPASNAASSQPKRNSIIYDQPLLCPSTGMRAGSRASDHSALSPAGLCHVPPLHTPKMGQSHNSITQPPSERPPPPPTQQDLVSPLLTSPLNVITLDSKRPSCGAHVVKPISISNSPSSSSSTSSSFRPNKSNSTNGPAQVGVQADGRLAAHSVDVDSGFCTSNSPASHDSESGPSGGIDSNEISFSSNRSKSISRTNSVILAPPSPRTAQLSIEEALVPLEESSITQEMANQTETVDLEPYDYDIRECDRIGSKSSSDEDSLGLDSQVEMIFGWLGVAQESHRDNVTNYENCIDLQQTIGTSMQDFHMQSLKASPESYCIESDSQREGHPDVEQPIDCTLSRDTASSSDRSIEQSMIAVSESEKVPQSGSHFSKPADKELPKMYANSLGEDGSARQCKEITLKVVVDENNKLNNGDEVFYINPTELKKISKSTESGKSEAETLTDEELCASVDKDSGFIRFTLRKRRALANNSEQQQVDVIESNEGQDHKLGSYFQDSHGDSSNSKRTKINEDLQEPHIENSDQDMRVVRPTIEQVKTSYVEQVEHHNQRKPSTDSSQMDISQASSSSTSSEMSIKSIVSFKGQQTETSVVEKEQVASLDIVEPELTTEHTEIARNRSDLVGNDDVLVKASDVESHKTTRCSLVSEAARKVDAAAAINQQPVAAARRTLERLDNNGVQNKAAKEKVDVKTLNCAPARRSICWPPPKPGDVESSTEDKSPIEPSVPVIGRVMANRLSFQKLIEEKNKNNSFVPVTNRPKPPPPVKPAGLVAPQRFKSQIN